MRELTAEELAQVEAAGVTIEELAAQWDLFPDQDFVTVVGSVVMLKNGQGQERSEPFVEEIAAPVVGEEPPAEVAE